MLDARSGSATLRVAGEGARDAFEHEAGGHRWQRVPPTEKRGRVQTSTVTVAVLPEPVQGVLSLNDRDLVWVMRRGTGPGGQHRNKTESAVTLTHTPTGLTVRCESERSQKQNKESALAVLKARLWERQRAADAATRAQDRRQQVGSGQRGDKRRTIRMRDGVVTDHVLGRQWSTVAYLRGEW